MRLSGDEQKTFARIAAQLDDAEANLRAIRNELSALYATSSSEHEALTPQPVAVARPEPKPQPLPAPVPAPVPVPRPPSTPWWEKERAVVRVVAAGGVLITLAGIALLVSLAIQSGWLGPIGRVVGAWILVALLFLGAYLVRRQALGREGFLALTTASLLAAHLTTIYAVADLHLWPATVGAGVMILMLALFSGLARAWDDQAMLNVSAITSFALFFVYFLTQDLFPFPVVAPALFLAVCSMGKRWRSSRTGAAVLGPLALPATFNAQFDGLAVFPVAVTVIIAVATFLTVTLLDEWDAKQDLPLGLYSPMLMLGIATLVSDSFLELTVMVAVVAAFSILSVQFHGAGATVPMTLLPLVYLFWSSRAPELQDHPLHGSHLVAAFFVLGCGFAWWLSRNNRYGGFPWASLLGVAMVISFSLGSSVLAKKPLWLTGGIALIQALTILAFLVVLFMVRGSFARFRVSVRVLIGIAGLHLSTLVIVTVVTYLFGLGGNSSMWLGYLVGHALVSISWMLVATYILVVDRSLSDSTSLVVGLVLAGAAAVKLVFFDLAALNGLPQVLAFLISGVALLAIASLRSRRTKV